MTDTPPCPDCETPLFVERSKGPQQWGCQRCGATFAPSLAFRAVRDRRGDAE